jgi:proton-translocating NADH-quinone oxidoreductase chain N
VETNSLILIPLIALLAGALLQILLGRVLSNTAKGWLALLCGLAALGGIGFLLPVVLSKGAVDLTLLNWDKGIQFTYRVDALSMLFNLMGCGIGSAILLYSIGYMAHEKEGTTRFYAFMLVFIAGLVSLVSAGSLLVAYVSWELIGLCSYFLVGFWYKQQAAAQGARKVLLMTHLAGYGLLVGILVLYARSGSFAWNDPALQASFTTGIFILMLVAAMAKSVIFPLHTWIPEAMNAPTPVSALLHSACYVKAGVYLIARLYTISPWQPGWNTIVLILGVVTMLVGALFALAQTDLKRLLAFSTISQIGHIITAFGLGTPLGIAAGLFYTVSHGLFKGTLFLCAGAVQHATGTRDMRKLGGLASRMPTTALIWLVAAASIVGVPLLNGFVAKWLLFSAAMDAGQVMVVLIAWLVSVITAFYMFKATVSVFYGEAPVELAKQTVHEAGWEMRAGMGILAALCVLFGVAPQILIQYVVAPAAKAMNFSGSIQVSWLGIQTGTSGISVTVGALVLLVALSCGGLVYAFSRPHKTEITGVFTGGDPLPVVADTVGAVDFTDLLETTLQPFYRFSNPDSLYMQGWQALSGFSSRLSTSVTGLVETRPLLIAVIMIVVVAALAWLK